MERNVTPFVINSLRVITFVFRINKGYFLVLYPSPPHPISAILFIFVRSTLLCFTILLGYLLKLHPFFRPRWGREKKKIRTDKRKTMKLRFVFFFSSILFLFTSVSIHIHIYIYMRSAVCNMCSTCVFMYRVWVIVYGVQFTSSIWAICSVIVRCDYVR